MPVVLKRNALLVIALSVATLCFFQMTKHDPALAKVNPFADDPYDSVSSFGVQFVLFTAVLSAVRAFRSYASVTNLKEQEAVVARGELMGAVAILVISLSNAIAMVRHVSMWRGMPGGAKLVWLTAGLFATAGLASWLLYQPVRSAFGDRRVRWKRMVAAVCASSVMLLFYPEGLRQTLWGELVTVLVGMALLFVPVWAVASAVTPDSEKGGDDLIDDAASIYQELKTATRSLAHGWTLIERLCSQETVQSVVCLLNPRRHRWSLALVSGALIGAALFTAEVIVEGGAAFKGRLLLLTAVFVGLETTGICMGYFLLSRLLCLVREAD